MRDHGSLSAILSHHDPEGPIRFAFFFYHLSLGLLRTGKKQGELDPLIDE